MKLFCRAVTKSNAFSTNTVAAVLRIGRIANQDEADPEASRGQQRLNDHGAAQQAHEESLSMAIDQMYPEAITLKVIDDPAQYLGPRGLQTAHHLAGVLI